VQPAIGTLSHGLYRILQTAGLKADFAAGHSYGEIAALWAAGVLDDETFFKLTHARGQAMSAPTAADFDGGAMLAVKGDIAQLQKHLAKMPDVIIANHNSTTQVVLAGSKIAVANAQTQLEAAGLRVKALAVSAAFHTEFVRHAHKPFAKAIAASKFNSPKIPVFSNMTGLPYKGKGRAIQTALKKHILQPVLFKQEIENIHAAGGEIFVEIGPKRVLTNLVKDILADKPHVAIALNPSSDKDSDWQLRDAVVQLAVVGVPLDNFDPHAAERVVIPVKPSPINVQLSGNNYVSPKTQKAYQAALTDGHRLAADSTAAPVPASATTQPKPLVAVPPTRVVKQNGVRPVAKSNGKVATPPPAIKQIMTPPPVQKTVANRPKLSTPPQRIMTQPQHILEQALTLLHQHQSETLRVHEAYLHTQEKFTATIVQLLQGNSGGQPIAPAAPPAIAPQARVIEMTPAAPSPAPAPVMPTLAPAPTAPTNGRSNGQRVADVPREVVVRPKVGRREEVTTAKPQSRQEEEGERGATVVQPRNLATSQLRNSATSANL
ncbi:MAG TPA: acyltransferase domain-containing protein, partial [Anaerolineae bacterium]|nr:acyltransferase domain-containing protein [Anaerolineae bacterium]